MNLNAPMSAHAISFLLYTFLTPTSFRCAHDFNVPLFLPFSLSLLPFFYLASPSSVLLDHLYVYVLL